MHKRRSRLIEQFPEIAHASNGSVFSPRDDYWKPWDIAGQRPIDFGPLRETCTSEFVYSAKRVFLWYLENTSVAGTFARFTDLIHILNALKDEQPRLYARHSIEPSEILRVRSLLGLSQEYRLLSIRTVITRWADMGYHGVSAETARVLERLKLKGNEHGAAVRTMDPSKGPFIEAELQAIHTAANLAFSNGDLNLRSYCMLWVFLSLGLRPIQVAMLKLKDLKVLGDQDQISSYLLEVPRAKQRDKHVRRQSFRARPLIPDIGKLIQAQSNSVKQQFMRLDLPKDLETADLPLFPNWQEYGPQDLRYHTYADLIAREFVAALNGLGVVSARTGEPVKYSAYRFRRTLGTRAAQEGLNEFAIAELLDHSSLHSAIIYVKSVPKILENIEKAFAQELAPIVSAFKGEIIGNEHQAKRSLDLEARLKVPDFESACGSCGHEGACNVLAPIGCYVCPHFQALENGPHEEILDNLIRRRKEILDQTNDVRIASVNDQLIFAVAEVVQRCKRKTSMIGAEETSDG